MIRRGTLAGFLVLISACGGRTNGEIERPPESYCVPGQQILCACSHGSVGYQTCRSDLTYGSCMCQNTTSSGGSGNSSSGGRASGGAVGAGGFPTTGGAFGLGGAISSGGAPGAAGAAGKTPISFEAPDLSAEASQASNIGLNARHDNLQPADVVRSPLAKVWTVDFGNKLSYPLVADGLVFALTMGAQPTLSAIDVDTGKMVWGPLSMGGRVTLAYDAHRIYTLNDSGMLSARSTSDGAVLWTSQMREQSFFEPAPVAANGKVYVNGSGFGGNTIAVNGETGAVLWSSNTFDGSEGSVAAVPGGVILAEACDQISYFSESTGQREWFYTNCTGGGGTTPGVYGTWLWVRDWAVANVIVDLHGNAHGNFAAKAMPAFFDGNVFYMSGGGISAVAIASTKQLWSFMDAKHTLCSSPVVAGTGRQVFVASDDGTVLELSADTGKTLSSDAAGGSIQCGAEGATLAIAQNHLFVPADKQLVAY